MTSRLGLILAACLALATPAAALPPVWRVTDDDSDLLIFGSIHVLPPGLEWRPPELDAAVGQAEDIWFELPVGPEAEQEVAALAAREGMLAPGKSLFAMLPSEDAERLVRVARAYGVDTAVLDRLEPWLAEVAMAGAAFRKAGGDGRYGVEQVIQGAAPAQAERRALETPAEQLGFLDQTPLTDQLAALRLSLEDLEADPGGYLEMVEAWLGGDLSGLDRQVIAPLRAASPELYARLVTDRNARWTRQLDGRLKGQGRTVVIVGVGHLIGVGSVPERLRALGYSVSGP